MNQTQNERLLTGGEVSSILLLLLSILLPLLLAAAYEAVKGLLADWLKARLQAFLLRWRGRRSAASEATREPRPLLAPSSSCRFAPAWERIAHTHDKVYALRRRTTP